MPPRDLQPLADMMLLAIKAALAPVQAELGAAKQANVDLRARVDELSGLRDRVTAMETKAAAPVAVLDTIPDRPSLAELELTMTKTVGPLSERLARLEERAPIAGPAGKDGADGLNGKDGADGLGFDDLNVLYDGDRTINVMLQRGDQLKSWPIVLPFLKQQGVFAEGKSYVHGDVVTWGGSQWHCLEDTTSKPGEGSKAWQLIVKRGRDGRDGQDAPGAVPVVKVR